MSLLDAGGAPVKKPPRIFIAIAAYGQFEANFGMSLAVLMHELEKEYVDNLFLVRDTILPRGRYTLVEKALEGDATHVLFLDTDMIFPPQCVELLLKRGEPIVGANYVRRKWPYAPTATRDGKHVWTDPDSTGVEAVDFLGFGVSLIQTDVFRGIDPPWFAYPVAAPGHYGSEDVYFFQRARDCGYTPYIDHDLSKLVKHIGELDASWNLAWNKRAQDKEEEAAA